LLKPHIDNTAAHRDHPTFEELVLFSM
jgi:hypothetical protein